MSKLLVIIVTYNGMKWLDKCLSSVINSTIKADLFIVDNGSTDGSIEFMKQNYPDARLVISKENLGFGKANNLGLQYAVDNNYDYVYLLNQDAWVEPDTFEKLVDIQKQNPTFGVLSPLQVNRKKNKLDKAFASCCGNELLSDCIMRQPLKPIYNTDFVMAAHWLISKDCLVTVGGFSPVFPHYGEDVNYIHRIQYHGLKCGIVPLTIGIHDREDRKTSKERSLHMYRMTWIAILSNPSLNKKARFGRLIVAGMNCISLDVGKSLANMAKTVANYYRIATYRKRSLSNRAFLKL